MSTKSRSQEASRPKDRGVSEELAKDASLKKWLPTGLPVMISVVALVFSGYSNFEQHKQSARMKEQVETQEKQLEEAKRQFAEAGPKFRVDSLARVWDGEEKSWTEIEKGTSVGYPLLQPPKALYIVAEVTNTGRSSGSLGQIGILKSATEKIKSDGVLCVDRDREGSGSPDLRACSFPKNVPAGETVKYYIQIDQAIIAKLTCNTYAGDGLTGYVEEANDATTTFRSSVSIAYTTWCDKIKPKSS